MINFEKNSNQKNRLERRMQDFKYDHEFTSIDKRKLEKFEYPICDEDILLYEIANKIESKQISQKRLIKKKENR